MGRHNAEISEVFTTGLVLNEGQRVGQTKILGSSSHILLSALQQISGNNIFVVSTCSWRCRSQF